MSAAAERIRKSNLRAQQSMWTRAEALAWAREQHRWPRRRFRVEGGAMGNSHLLGEKAADSTRARYGGRVVELIPPFRDRNRPEACG